jgi:chloride channel 3/4/5
MSSQEASAGEICHSWQTWDQALGLRATALRGLTQYLLYIVLGVVCATVSARLVRDYAPQAFHSGLPEIKAILGGYIIKDFLSKWVVTIKALGLVTAVASGLSLGKEGPLVHVACCIGHQVSLLFPVFRNNEARQRQILSAAAAAGLSAAFGAPVGGVLFSLEEASSCTPLPDVYAITNASHRLLDVDPVAGLPVLRDGRHHATVR